MFCVACGRAGGRATGRRTGTSNISSELADFVSGTPNAYALVLQDTGGDPVFTVQYDFYGPRVFEQFETVWNRTNPSGDLLSFLDLTEGFSVNFEYDFDYSSGDPKFRRLNGHYVNPGNFAPLLPDPSITIENGELTSNYWQQVDLDWSSGVYGQRTSPNGSLSHDIASLVTQVGPASV